MFALFAVSLAVAAIAFVVAPLAARRSVASDARTEAQFYRAQLEEVRREAERGDLSGEEAAQARAEAARRLLRLDAETPAQAAPQSARLRTGAIFACLAAIVGASAVYRLVGSPDAPDLPLAERSDALKDMTLQAAIERIESHLKQSPDDGRGWEVLAPAYVQAGRLGDAVHAFKEALRLKGPNSALSLRLGEAMVTASGGQVTPEALAAFKDVLAKAPSNPEAQFYVALSAAQGGDRDKALAMFTALAAVAPKDAPWLKEVENQLAALKGPAGAAPGSPTPPPGQSADQQAAMIQGMVKGLAERLAANGGSSEDWLRLIRAYVVLQKPDDALKALADARAAHVDDKAALAAFDGLARELGIVP